VGNDVTKIIGRARQLSCHSAPV